MKDTIIFDLDGTLANVEHRVHLVRTKPYRWKQFFAACGDDTVNEHVRLVYDLMWCTSYKVVIFSGRSEEVREQTEEWLRENKLLPTELRMRPAGDFTPDDQLKERWLHEYGKERVFCTFDDRQKVVDMWRRNGIPCFQVAPGDF